MANIDASGLTRDIRHLGTFGNKSCEHEKIVAKQPNNADVLRFMKLPRGTKITGFREYHGAAGGDATTIKYGYLPVDGSAGNDAAFIPAVACVAAGGNSMNLPPVVLPKDSYIVGTIGGNNAANAVDWDVIVDYIYPGLG